MEINSFFAKHLYFDNKNYPRGFSRYGYFTIIEAKLLERCGHAYNALYRGIRKPVTDEEKKFIEVCNGERMPSNEHEKVWIKYMEHTSRPKRFHTLSGGKPPIDVIDDYIDNEEEKM